MISDIIGVFFSFIWVLVIIGIVKASQANAKNRKNNGAQNPGGTPYPGQSGNSTPYAVTPQYNNTGNRNVFSGNGQTQRPAATPVSPVPADRDGDGKVSTIEYLNMKAREDEIEHQKDEYLTQQKLTQGGLLKLGMRIPDDGMIPRGMRMVYCGYCGAENLVPGGLITDTHYCYFCHEKL